MSYGQGAVNFINLLTLKPYGLFNNSVFRLTTTIAFTHSPYLLFTFSPLHLFFQPPTSDFRLRTSDSPLLLMSYGQGAVNFINLLTLKPYGLFNNSVFRLTTTIAFIHSPYLLFTFSPLHLFFRLPTSDFGLPTSDSPHSFPYKGHPNNAVLFNLIDGDGVFVLAVHTYVFFVDDGGSQNHATVDHALQIGGVVE